MTRKISLTEYKERLPEPLRQRTLWSDAPHWLPKILRGVRLNAEFTFDRQLGVEEVNIIREELG